MLEVFPLAALSVLQEHQQTNQLMKDVQVCLKQILMNLIIFVPFCRVLFWFFGSNTNRFSPHRHCYHTGYLSCDSTEEGEHYNLYIFCVCVYCLDVKYRQFTHVYLALFLLLLQISHLQVNDEKVCMYIYVLICM